MRGLGINTVIAVDVGAQDETDLTNYGDSLSGWWVLWKKWMPFTEPVKVLNMAEIQSRLAYVSCVRQLEIVKKASYCHYVRAPIDKYQTLDFAKYEEIFNNAYEYGKQLFDEWAKNGKLDEILNFSSTSPAALLSKKESLTRAAYPPPFLTTGQITTSSFTDLAALVSKITRPRHSSIYLSDVSEESSLSETDADMEKENTRLLEQLGSLEDGNSRFSTSQESNVLFSAGTLDEDTTSSTDLLPVHEKCDSGIVDPPNFSEVGHT
uniref:Patatin-like phospholipase domain-containing protein 7 n=1 Tax=Romanomermis culicivorax TaxID=13658 RepID=A0A915KWL2_ROMCU